MISEKNWQVGDAKTIAVFLNGDIIPNPDAQGNPIQDDSFLIFFNAQAEVETFLVPPHLSDRPWHLALDTKLTPGFLEEMTPLGEAAVVVGARSLMVLLCPHQPSNP